MPEATRTFVWATYRWRAAWSARGSRGDDLGPSRDLPLSNVNDLVFVRRGLNSNAQVAASQRARTR